jgi:hypothetical protein
MSSLVPPPSEGRIAIVTDVGSGMRWTPRDRKTSETGADGEIVWSWRPDAGVKLCETFIERRWLKSPVHRGEREDKPLKPIAQGMPDCFGEPVVTNACAFYTARAAAGAPNTRHSLRPPFLRG